MDGLLNCTFYYRRHNKYIMPPYTYLSESNRSNVYIRYYWFMYKEPYMISNPYYDWYIMVFLSLSLLYKFLQTKQSNYIF